LPGDIHRLRTNGAEVAAELTAFVAKMKGRSPQEVLGEIAQSTLTKGMIVATVWTIISMVVLTVIPFARAKAFPPAAKPLAAESKSDSSTPAPAAQPAKGDTSTASTGNVNDPDGKLLKKLNMDETKNADPKVNPLDALGNDLLKDLK
jgi:hypothetical protein